MKRIAAKILAKGVIPVSKKLRACDCKTRPHAAVARSSFPWPEGNTFGFELQINLFTGF
jgi:hypothetical protein